MVGQAPAVTALKDLRLSVAAGEFVARCLSNPGYCRGAPSSTISDWCCVLLKPPRLDMRRIQRTGPVLVALRQRILDPQMPGLLGQAD